MALSEKKGLVYVGAYHLEQLHQQGWLHFFDTTAVKQIILNYLNDPEPIIDAYRI
jgi:hypothetical protein